MFDIPQDRNLDPLASGRLDFKVKIYGVYVINLDPLASGRLDRRTGGPSDHCAGFRSTSLREARPAVIILPLSFEAI